MVQTTLLERPQVETREPTLRELAQELGIPLVVRPWWGSVRQQAFEAFPARWVCPAGYSYMQVKWPEVERGVVVMWEGRCRDHYGKRVHNHTQDIVVLDADVAVQAMLVEVAVNSYGVRFLVGMDDAHPFVTHVLRRLSTVEEAFHWLVPLRVLVAQISGDVPRQGDWFFIPHSRPVNETEAEPCPPDAGGRDTRRNLEKNVIYSYAPLIQGWGDATRHIGERVIYRSHPWPLVRGYVSAPDHPPLHLSSWHEAVRTRSTPGGGGD